MPNGFIVLPFVSQNIGSGVGVVACAGSCCTYQIIFTLYLAIGWYQGVPLRPGFLFPFSTVYFYRGFIA